jgi:hypothetical protein
VEIRNYLELQGFAPAELQQTPNAKVPGQGSSAGVEGYEAARLVKLLGPENQPEKLVWLDGELRGIVAAAHLRLVEKGNETPSRRALTAAVKERMIAYWNHQSKAANGSLSPAQRRDRRSDAAVAEVKGELGL